MKEVYALAYNGNWDGFEEVVMLKKGVYADKEQAERQVAIMNKKQKSIYFYVKIIPVIR
jgi:hypothetical protein